MRIVYVLLVSLLSAFPNHDDVNDKIEVRIKEGSHLYIKGTSNVNTFTCNYIKPIKPQRFTLFYEDYKNGWLLNDADLFLESASFDCGGRRINKDFEELIQTSEFPTIHIEVKEIKALESCLQAIIQITIAGKTKHLPVQVALGDHDEKIYTSVLQLNINDFNLETPTKMMGLIKVHEEISIHVHLRLGLSV
ncbi:YceI family protein [Psychroflexus sp. YR1-1]|uniref:YceI family protein n=1 Tax=Psychroflexus aurantiacus TaxID=2709310 RepID=A0A6B3QX74_9FLAO|nr:YceI family protein [Psychroflexus aurantiacus]NEV92706.1 YceI family protein [Psychroflexus aurantiacus]